MDVFLFVSILGIYIWAVVPLHVGPWGLVFPAAALLLAGSRLGRGRQHLRSLGLRLDNLPVALGLYLAAGMIYASIVLLAHEDWWRPLTLEWRYLAGIPKVLCWAFIQELCLLGFLLPRFRELTGRSTTAVVGAASVFALFHLPNPFLTLFTLGGGIILGWLYLRVPNLIAAAVAHAFTSALVSGVLPGVITGSFKVGHSYVHAFLR